MEYVAVLLPSLVVGLIFWFAMKSIFNADKSERQAEARAQAEADARAPVQEKGEEKPQEKPQPGTRPDSQPGARQEFPSAGPSTPSAESDQ